MMNTDDQLFFLSAEDRDKIRNLITTRSSVSAVGIFLGENHVQVGTFDPDYDLCIEEIAAKIPVTLEKEANIKGRFKSAPIVSLLSSDNASIPFRLKDRIYPLSPLDVLQLYFRRLFIAFREAGLYSLQRLIVIYSGALDPKQEFRLKRSIEAGGIRASVEVLSSHVTAAISSASRTVPRKDPLYVFVIHPLRSTFTMAIVKVSSDSVLVKCSFDSRNLHQCQNRNFKDAHSRMIDGSGISKEDSKAVLSCYKVGVERLLGREISFDQVAVVSQKPSPDLLQILNYIFEKEIRVLGEEAVLCGSRGLVSDSILVGSSKFEETQPLTSSLALERLLLDLNLPRHVLITGSALRANGISGSTVTDTLNASSEDIRKESDKAPEYNAASDGQKVSRESMSLVRSQLERSVEEGVRIHRELMYKMTDGKEPYTSKQIQLFAQENLDRVLGSFQASYSPLQSSNCHQIIEAVQAAEEELKKKINFQTPTYLKRHEILMGKLTASINEWTLEAENNYDDTLDEFLEQRRTRTEILDKHQEIAEMVLNEFRNHLTDNGMQWHDFYKIELESKLQDKLEDAVQSLAPDQEDALISGEEPELLYDLVELAQQAEPAAQEHTKKELHLAPNEPTSQQQQQQEVLECEAVRGIVEHVELVLGKGQDENNIDLLKNEETNSDATVSSADEMHLDDEQESVASGASSPIFFDCQPAPTNAAEAQQMSYEDDSFDSGVEFSAHQASDDSMASPDLNSSTADEPQDFFSPSGFPATPVVKVTEEPTGKSSVTVMNDAPEHSNDIIPQDYRTPCTVEENIVLISDSTDINVAEKLSLVGPFEGFEEPEASRGCILNGISGYSPSPNKDFEEAISVSAVNSINLLNSICAFPFHSDDPDNNLFSSPEKEQEELLVTDQVVPTTSAEGGNMALDAASEKSYDLHSEDGAESIIMKANPMSPSVFNSARQQRSKRGHKSDTVIYSNSFQVQKL